ncbi:phosphoglycerate transporter [Mycetocola zhadangensis]|uniref:Phosphoglycerate transporter n=2 Tax=Mycetocola zhadangensis TaxID=1164595 RepID=A0A3L7J4I8_9MICO|nr:phosphoglycerate transporter [Mycetocola zhadangensis]
MTTHDLRLSISECSLQLDRPITVGISGYCGSGKSTITRQLLNDLPGSIRMRGDDFLDPARSHVRSNDWDGVDRERLARDVLKPFRSSQATQFRRYDWARRELGDLEPLPQANVLVVDAIGLFHPDTLPALDLTVWVDVELDIAAERGKRRDRSLGRNHDSLWDDVWIPNERAFDKYYRPRSEARFFVTPELPELSLSY